MNRNYSRKNWLSLLAVAALVVSGCGNPDPPAFRMDMVKAVSLDGPISEKYQQEVSDVLQAMFGSPDEPYAMPETGLDQSKLDRAAGPAWSDEAGYNHGLYRKHCVHCHGITGDGRGPTALFLNPYPRDYRAGLYKFKTTYNAAKPTDEDLHRVLVNGVPGTAMPSFSLLPESEVEALVEYVKYLSYRGQMEAQLILYVADNLGEEEEVDDDDEPILDKSGNPKFIRPPFDPTTNEEQRADVLALLADEVVAGWDEANEQLIVPDESAIPADDRSVEEVMASAEKGRELFFGTRANCFTCHGPTALGDGQQDDFDNWQKPLEKFVKSVREMAEKPAEEVDEEDLALLKPRLEVVDSLYPIRNAIPRNLRQGIYRGGNRRLDMFCRVYAGIPGTPMPASGPASAGAKGTLTEEEMWNIVDYIWSLPYESSSRPQTVTPQYTESLVH